jgi:hypothetical protein
MELPEPSYRFPLWRQGGQNETSFKLLPRMHEFPISVRVRAVIKDSKFLAFTEGSPLQSESDPGTELHCNYSYQDLSLKPSWDTDADDDSEGLADRAAAT